MVVAYYAEMADLPAHIVLNIETRDPVELSDFVATFSALASQFERYIKENYPEADGIARMFVHDVHRGSIIAELAPFVSSLIATMDQAIIVEQFIRLYGARLLAYFKTGGRAPDASKSELKDFMRQLAAIGRDPKGRLSIAAARFVDGKREVMAAIEFATPDAREALQEIEDHTRELEAVSRADHERALMVFRRSDIGDASIGKPSGERVVIDEISDKARPLVYASALVEERIKHVLRNAEENPYKMGFVVDVNERIRDGKTIAYAVTTLHEIIDLGDE